jgi:pyridinium-3,5-biscarboxylic acid mononucleotide synthase
MNKDQLVKLLEDVKMGGVAVDDAVKQIASLPFADIGFARVDKHRYIRCGFPEIIFCQGKAVGHVVEIFREMASTGHNVLATRADEDMFAAIDRTGEFPAARYEPLGRTITLKQQSDCEPIGRITVVTAGTADIPVAMEAVTTAEILGQNVELICDVGVAGLHRLLEKLPQLQDSNVVIAIAGMEGALASVVGGLVSCPVIAVPTSVGYGTSFGGVTALLTMLNSCSSGVSVVNIDNGFSAAYNASVINSMIESARKS